VRIAESVKAVHVWRVLVLGGGTTECSVGVERGRRIIRQVWCRVRWHWRYKLNLLDNLKNTQPSSEQSDLMEYTEKKLNLYRSIEGNDARFGFRIDALLHGLDRVIGDTNKQCFQNRL
jgi:hypothetical protein